MKIGDKVRIIDVSGWQIDLGVRNRKTGVVNHYASRNSIGVVIDGFDRNVYFRSEQLELVEERPERYASREVHGMDVLDLINHWGLNFSEGCILKYLLRDKGEDISDFKKIADYANREVKRLEK